ncbi:exodeoxyribonuclease 1 [Ephemerocybe angulata]|uniref:Exodeoxyribonuclease 1 n=1 Tax=Ephemerocybe angulata TaxID=980116 RepID=A0A8H6MFI3_9AGAR|nr:exodeoxyribonuclease 1 [Tulosesus angulatus]
MGISGLLPALKSIQTTRHLKEYAGQTVAVDAYVWLHKGVYACATDLAMGKPTTRYVEYAMHRVRMLRHYKIEPFIVFDGGPLPAKKGTESDRKKRRAENLKKGKALVALGKQSQAREFFVKCVDVTPEMAFQFIKALKAESVKYIVAPYEADPQLAFLELKGHVDAILTEDSDLLVFGCKNVLFKLDTTAHTVVAISRADFGSINNSCSDISLVGWTDAKFRAMAILSGCDYLPSIPGIGLKTSCNLLRKWKTPEQVIKAVMLEGKKAVPVDYAKNFARAEKCFLHQRVWCPDEEKLVHMTPVDGEWTEEFDEYCGSDLEPSLAKQLACGDVDPVHLLPMVDINPGFKPQGFRAPGARADVKGKGKEVDLPKPKAKGGLHNFFGPNPTIPPRTKVAPAPLQSQSNRSVGKASGKRTLVEIADQDIAARKKHKPRQSTPAMLPTSKFFAPQQESGGRQRSVSAPRRHTLDPSTLAGPSRLSQDQEKENLVPDDWEDEVGDDDVDYSDLSCRAQKPGDSEDAEDLDLVIPSPVEQEDGYISPMAPSSPVNNGQDLSSPSRPHQYLDHDDDFGDPVSSPMSAIKRRKPYSRLEGVQPLLLAPRRTASYSDDDCVIATPATSSRETRNVSAGTGQILVEDTPTPATRSYVLNASNRSPPRLYVGPDIRDPFEGPEFGDSDVGVGLVAVGPSRLQGNGSQGSLGSATPLSPSPDTPVSARGVPQVEVIVVSDDDEAARQRDERVQIVAKGWKEKWALGAPPSGSSSASSRPHSRVDSGTKATKGKGKKKHSLSPSKLKRSNTNVTPVGLHRLSGQSRLSFPLPAGHPRGQLGSVTTIRTPVGAIAKGHRQRKVVLQKSAPIVVDDMSDEDDEITMLSSPPRAAASATLLDRFKYR